MDVHLGYINKAKRIASAMQDELTYQRLNGQPPVRRFNVIVPSREGPAIPPTLEVDSRLYMSSWVFRTGEAVHITFTLTGLEDL